MYEPQWMSGSSMKLVFRGRHRTRDQSWMVDRVDGWAAMDEGFPVMNVLGQRQSDNGDRNKGRSGQYSIRINDQWRVCFRWTDGGAENVEIVDYH